MTDTAMDELRRRADAIPVVLVGAAPMVTKSDAITFAAAEVRRALEIEAAEYEIQSERLMDQAREYGP
jgi:hypothetical protein